MNKVDQYQSNSTPLPEENGTKTIDDLYTVFLQNVSHELRTPLHVIKGYSELLHDGALGALAPEQQEAIFIIANRAWQLQTLVEHITTYLAAEARSHAREALVLSDIVADVASQKRAAINLSDLTLTMSLMLDLPPVQGDWQHLYQAVDCLLDNAIKFTPTGGQIELKTYVEPGWVCLSVCDSGIGVAEGKQAEDIFKLFYQVDNSSTRRYGGLGFGLSVAKSVIEAHAGQVEVTSRSEQGSCFIMKLPVSSTAVHTEQIESKASPQRILIVDDEKTVALILQDALEILPDCEVSTANSAEEAWQLFDEQPFDLLITDYKMPGTDGITLAERVRKFYPQTTIVMVTAYASSELHEQAAQVAIQRILDKPVRINEIRHVASEALGQGVG